jgi:hypothetical protein
VESLRKSSADQIWAVEPHGFGRSHRIERVSEVGGNICPYLHAKTEGKITVSVCGGQKDRLILARHHLDRWCLAGEEDCPHRRRVADE